MDEEAVRVGVAGIGLLGRVGLCMMVVVPLRLALSIVEDDDFIDAEDGEGSRYLPG